MSETSFSRRPATPLLLRVIMFGSFAVAAMFLVVGTAFGIGFVGRKGANWVAPWLLLVGALALVIAVGLHRGRAWARPVLVGVLALWSCGNLVVYGIYGYVRGPGYVHWAPAAYLAAFAWYLYWKPNVRAYFASLKAGQA